MLFFALLVYVFTIVVRYCSESSGNKLVIYKVFIKILFSGLWLSHSAQIQTAANFLVNLKVQWLIILQ